MPSQPRMARGLLVLALVHASIMCTLGQATAPAQPAEASASKISQSKVATEAAAAAPTGTQPQASAASDESTNHVLELGAASAQEALQGAVQVFRALGASDQDAAAILGKVQAEGRAVVMEGTKDALGQVAAAFQELGLQCSVRPKTSEDEAGRAAAAKAAAEQAAGAARGGGAATSGASVGTSAGGREPGTVYSKEYAGTGVTVLDATGFKTQLAHKDAPPTLVVFFAPWCGHCVKMVPEVAKAAARLGSTGVRVVAVDCDRAPEVARSLGIKGYPTVKFMARGKSTAYEGPRSALHLVAFAQGQARLDMVMKYVDKVLDPIKMVVIGLLKKK